jgi:hypothetical protein
MRSLYRSTSFGVLVVAGSIPLLVGADLLLWSQLLQVR